MSDRTVDLIGNARNVGFQHEKQHGNCCQSTIAALQDTLGQRDDSVFQAGSGMAGGVGIHCDGVCGGYSGGVMQLSRMFGRTRERIADGDSMDLTNRLASKLHARFVSEYGSVICRDIHQKIFGRTFDLWNAQDSKAIEAAGSHVDKCTTVVGNASAWAAEIALEERARREGNAR